MNLDNLLTPESAMSLAIHQAYQGLGRVSPNPPVGAVFLNKEGKCLSTGYHKKYGTDHAEINALNAISDPDQLKSASLYVTLEPCSHKGLTPSCAQRLSQLPLSKVCIGLMDPNPNVHGKGITILQQAGIEVEMYKGPLIEKLEELIEVFIHNLKHKKPFLGIKIASSLDGSIAIPKRKWLTGESSRSHVALLRGHYDSVCIGVNTLIEDNPRLNSRHPDFLNQENTVIILDPKGKSFSFLEKSNLLKVRNPHKIIIVTNCPQNSPYTILKSPVNEKGQFNLTHILTELFEKGISSILIEGGGIVFSHFLPLSQRIFLFLTPLLAGQTTHSKKWTQFLPKKDGAFSLKKVSYSTFDQDILITGRLFDS